MRRLCLPLSRGALTVASSTFRFNATKPTEEPAAAAEETTEKKLLDEDCPKLKRIKDLEAKLRDTNERVSDLKKDILYTTADMQNLHRLQEKEAADAKAYAVKEFGKDMIEMSKKLTEACKQFSELPAEVLEGNKVLSSIQTGTLMSERVVLKVLKKHGFEVKGFQEVQ